MSEYTLELYITGNSVRSENALRSIEAIFNTPSAKMKYKLDVIDVLEAPEIAEREKVIATPTLIKRVPPPVRRIVGDLSDIELVKKHLDLI